MSGKDQSVISKESLMSTKPGKQIIKQALFKSKGYKLFNKYKEETENQFPNFAERFAKGLLHEIQSDTNPNATQQAFGDEVGSTEIILNASEITTPPQFGFNFVANNPSNCGSPDGSSSGKSATGV